MCHRFDKSINAALERQLLFRKNIPFNYSGDGGLKQIINHPPEQFT